MAGLTVYSTLPPLVQAYYDKKFLIRAKHLLVAAQFAQKRTLAKSNGKTIYFSRYTPLAKVTSALDETITGGITRGTEKQLNIEETAATIAYWGDYVDISKLASSTSKDPEVSEKVGIISQQAGESIDYDLIKNVCTNTMRRRADGDANYQVEGTGTSGSTTTIADTINLTQADDYWNGGYIVITAGTNYGEVRKVSDFANATGLITVSVAFPKACDTTSTFRVVVGTGLAATDVLETANIRLATRDLKRNKTLKMDSGFFASILDPDTEYDFMGDDAWVKAATYKDRVDSLYQGEIGKWFGVRFVMSTQLYRESVAGTEDLTSGAVHAVPILGRECFGAVELEGQGQMIIQRTPEQLGQPLNMSGTCGWQAAHVAKTLNGMFGVSLLCGATA